MPEPERESANTEEEKPETQRSGYKGRGVAFTPEKAREAAQERWRLAREKAAREAEVLRAPRETIADELMQDPALLRRAVRSTLEQAADGDTQSQRVLFGWLDQGYGKPSLDAPTREDEAGLLPMTREEKALLMATIEAELARREEDSSPLSED